MKVLINCYACSPYRGSEPGMGWNFVKHLSKQHELHILTESKFKVDLDKYFKEHPSESKHFHFYFIEKERHKKLRKIWPPSYYWFYKQWQKKALKLAKELDEKEHFDLIHQLNMVGYREPGYLYKLKKPLVWGPIGGAHQVPWSLLPSLGFYGMIYYGARNLFNIKDLYWGERTKKMTKCCGAIIAATQDMKNACTKVWHKDAIIIPEVGLVEESEACTSQRRTFSAPLRFAWCGLHTPSKALNIALCAVAACKNRNNVELHVIGKGEYTKRWKKLATKLGLNNVVWHGWVQRNEAIQIMQSCHVMVITSLADLTSTVLLEALSYGLPVIATNHCGFANVINDSCGIKVDLKNYNEVVKGFADAFDRMYEDENFRYQLSQGALHRRLNYTWSEKSRIVNEIYTKVLDAEKSKH